MSLEKIRTKKIEAFEPIEYVVEIKSQKDLEKFIGNVEKCVRKAMEYGDLTKYLGENADMRRCMYFRGVDKEKDKRVRVEIHHAPLTLFNIAYTVINKWMMNGIPLNDLLIADEVLKIHYLNYIGLIPLSKTVHKLVHSESDDRLIVPNYLVYGNFEKFIEEYEDYIPDPVMAALERSIEETDNIREDSFKILETEYTYYECEGYVLPKKIPTKNGEVG